MIARAITMAGAVLMSLFEEELAPSMLREKEEGEAEAEGEGGGEEKEEEEEEEGVFRLLNQEQRIEAAIARIV